MAAPQRKTAGDWHRPAAQEGKHHGHFSTATEAQLTRVLALLRARPHTSYELSRQGIYHPPRRVKDLRDRGFSIETGRVTLTDIDGFRHVGCALYSLIEEPGVSQ